MGLFRFRALVTVDAPPARDPAKTYQSGTRALMIHACRTEEPAYDKYFPAMMTWEDERELHPGERAVVTLTVAAADAPCYLGAGQHFTLWGAGYGHGVISRRVFFE